MEFVENKKVKNFFRPGRISENQQIAFNLAKKAASATNVTVEILPKLLKNLLLHSLIQELMKQDIDMKEIV